MSARTRTHRARCRADCGAIFAQVIRLWAIVPNHDRVPHEIGRILRSHSRGQHCRVCRVLAKQSLKACDSDNDGTGRRADDDDDASQKIPKTFAPREAEKAMQLLISMLKIECKLAMKLLFEGWDFFSDTWILAHEVIGNDLVSDLVAVWLVCTLRTQLHVS